MKITGIFQPQALPFDWEEWKKKPFPERVKMLCQAWALQGYGAPVTVYVFYILKIGLYVGLWIFFCSLSAGLGSLEEIGDWWYAPEAILKAVLWSMLFEGMGLGSGSGPLTARYWPPIGGILYFARPGTIKLPMFQGVPLIGGDQRTWVDVLAYLAHCVFLVRALVAPVITPDLLYPTVFLLPLLGILDKTLFLVSRAEHYYIALICFLFPADTFSGLQLVWLAIWIWAATSKLNRHFPAVVCVMVSNSAVLRIPWLRKRMYASFPDDLRPGPLARWMAHAGTIVELVFPFLLVLGGGGPWTAAGLIIMFLFHLFITSNVPMAVPIEWNFMMVYGAFALFGQYGHVWAFDITSPVLILLLGLCLLILPLAGNFFPRWISFLISMRYYAGNWAYNIWLFRGNTEEKLDQHLVKASPTVLKQLGRFYDRATAESLITKVIGFRFMHLHGRALRELIPKAVDDINAYSWRDGELIAGVVLGWNFGDGHLHHEQLLNAIQKRCGYESGELRCIMVESEPMGRGYLKWRIVDAKDGKLEEGSIRVADLGKMPVWPDYASFNFEPGLPGGQG